MSDEAAFLSALKANPADDTARLVYADWLDEHDEPQKAEYLRLVAVLARSSELATRDSPKVARLCTLGPTLSEDWRLATADRFKLVLYLYTDKVYAIRVIRELTGLGLGEAKEISERLPAEIFSRCTYEHAIAGLERLLGARATLVRIHPLEKSDLPILVRYQIIAYHTVHSSNNARHDVTRAAEATAAFTRFLSAALKLDPTQVAALAQEQSVVVADNLEPSAAHTRVAELWQLLPNSERRAGWSIWLDMRPITASTT